MNFFYKRFILILQNVKWKTLLNYMKSLFAKTDYFYDAIMLFLCFIVLFVCFIFLPHQNNPTAIWSICLFNMPF